MQSIPKVIFFAAFLMFVGFDASAADSRIEWIQNNGIELSSIDPNDVNFSDLAPIGKAVGRRDIVMLGEASHMDGATFSAKIRLVKYLVEKKGFKIIAFESGLFDVKKVNEFVAVGSEPVEAFRQGIISSWSRIDEMVPLFQYLAEKKVKIVGFDCQFTGAASTEFLVPDLRSFLKRVRIGEPFGNDFFARLQHVANGDYRNIVIDPLTSEEKDQFLTQIQSLLTRVLSIETRHNDKEFWVALLSSVLKSADLHLTPHAADPTNPDVVKLMNLRDRVMADNLLWQINQANNQKIVVWAASWHNLRNPLQIQEFPQAEIMGDYVWKVVGNRIYNIAFTAYEGTFGYNNGSRYGIIEDQIPNEDELEELFSQTDLSNTILELSRLPKKHWLRNDIYMRPFGYRATKGNWPEVFDAIFLHRVMFPVTKSD